VDGGGVAGGGGGGEKGGNVAKTLIFQNYLGIGVDAQAAGDYTHPLLISAQGDPLVHFYPQLNLSRLCH